MSEIAGNGVLLLGEDHGVGGELVVVSAGRLAAAICVGDERADTWRHKGYTANEDALSGRDAGRFARLVVSDSHFGYQASHVLVDALHHARLDEPTPNLELDGTDDGSETTLTSVWADREAGHLHVHSLGDSQALRLRKGVEPLVLHPMDGFYTAPDQFSWDLIMDWRYEIVTGDALIAFTDGVHECHRGHPETSILATDVSALFEQASGLEEFVRELAVTALVGVGPNPGGEDNFAIFALEV